MCEMKQEGQFSKNNNLLQYAIQLVCVLKWNKRDSFQKKTKKTPIYYSMLFNLCAYWNETRWTVFKKIQKQYATIVRNETRGAVFKKQQFITMLFNLCAYWNETRGTVFKKKKQQFITVCYSTCVHIEMKQEGQFSKKTIYYSMLFKLKWNKRDSFQKTTIYYSMLFNLCAYWNETRGTVFKKIQLNKCTNCAKWNKRGSFQKTTIYYSMLFNLCAYWNETRGTVFKKIQLMTICY